MAKILVRPKALAVELYGFGDEQKFSLKTCLAIRFD